MCKFFDLETQQRYILQEEANISKRELRLLVDWLRVFLESFDKASKCLQIPFRNPKLRVDVQSQKTISLLLTTTISFNIQMDKFVHRSVLESTIVAFFPSKILNYTTINVFLPRFSSTTSGKFTTSATTDLTLQTSGKNFKAFAMCSAFTLDFRHDNSIIQLTGNVCCPNTICSDIICVHKKTFQSLERSDYQCAQ